MWLKREVTGLIWKPAKQVQVWFCAEADILEPVGIYNKLKIAVVESKRPVKRCGIKEDK